MDSRLVLGVLVLCACGAQLGDSETSPDADVNSPDGAVSPDGQQMLGPWGTPAMVPGGDSASDEDDCTLSSTRTEMYFKRDDAGNQNLYMMTRATPTSPWGAPQPLTLLNSSVAEESPRLTPDDLTLYFGRNGDIYKSVRSAVGQPWMGPTPVGVLNTAEYEKWAAVCSSGYVIVARNTAAASTELFEGTVTSGAPTALANLNSPQAEQGAMLTTDCLRVYYQSSRDGNFNIYTATRLSPTAAWTNPTQLPDFNTPTFGEEDAWISADQRMFFYASNKAGNKDLYFATR